MDDPNQEQGQRERHCDRRAAPEQRNKRRGARHLCPTPSYTERHHDELHVRRRRTSTAVGLKSFIVRAVLGRARPKWSLCVSERLGPPHPVSKGRGADNADNTLEQSERF